MAWVTSDFQVLDYVEIGGQPGADGGKRANKVLDDNFILFIWVLMLKKKDFI